MSAITIAERIVATNPAGINDEAKESSLNLPNGWSGTSMSKDARATLPFLHHNGIILRNVGISNVCA